jgi:wyosine [tRNA(Phe)-imidazoG37] synthetase (radical SAM superfamily)
MFEKIKKKIKEAKNKKRPVIFLSIFSNEPICYNHMNEIVSVLRDYGNKNGIEFAVFNNTIVKPIEREQLKELFDYIYKTKFEERRDEMPNRNR